MSDIERTKSDKAFVKSWSVEIPSKVRTKLSATHSPFVFEENYSLAVWMILSEVFFYTVRVLCLKQQLQRTDSLQHPDRSINFKKTD